MAPITPPGEGGVAAVRIAGPNALSIFSSRFKSSHQSSDKVEFSPFLMRHGIIHDTAGAPIDEVLAVFMPAGRSYTGLDQTEIFCHGGRAVLASLMRSLLEAGARAARPGEFTQIAFLNGRIDLSKAEAVADMVAANTEQSLVSAREHVLGAYSEHICMLRKRLIDILAEIEASIDYPEEEISPAEVEKLQSEIHSLVIDLENLAESYNGGRIVREGFKVVIAGRPNAGKSSLFNLLLKQERALVSPNPGTTRDYLSEWIDLDGFAVNLIDTAGLRSGGGQVEQAGQKSARNLIESADLVLWIVDLTDKGWQRELKDDLQGLPKNIIMLVHNKIDALPGAVSDLDSGSKGLSVFVSCVSGEGLDKLKQSILSIIDQRLPDLTDGLMVTSARHYQKLNEAVKNLNVAAGAISDGQSPEIVALDLRRAAANIDEITGRIYNEEILESIFSKFCVGK